MNYSLTFVAERKRGEAVLRGVLGESLHHLPNFGGWRILCGQPTSSRHIMVCGTERHCRASDRDVPLRELAENVARPVVYNMAVDVEKREAAATLDDVPFPDFLEHCLGFAGGHRSPMTKLRGSGPVTSDPA